ncbi:MAG: 50S ribosomal protein L4 [SAR324 cluster bacterium]|jgi:large subunit ribosomal protein L4|nr:50S ribosomal protein L4 [SAR324 cluster bacterium]|tara:strand:+ start:576 stop:1199 length:624 start_codon:yes stop_codon:yes gene_type:complete
MANLNTLDLNNKPSGQIELNDQILETEYHPQAIKQAVVGFLAANRQGTHSTKTRAEVSYSTKKLYRQKGTGNARSGSNKSPIRRHGGITFGPSPRDYSIRSNKKFRKLALRSAIAEKIRQNQLVILEELKLEDHKTKNLKKVLETLEAPKALIVTENMSRELMLASRNLQGVHAINQQSLNVYELLRFPKVIFVKDAMESLNARLSG